MLMLDISECESSNFFFFIFVLFCCFEIVKIMTRWSLKSLLPGLIEIVDAIHLISGI